MEGSLAPCNHTIQDEQLIPPQWPPGVALFILLALFQLITGTDRDFCLKIQTT